MGDESTEAGDETGQQPGGRADLLGEMKALRRRARSARHAYWFPLVLFGLLTCLSVPFYIQPGGPSGSAAQANGGAPGLPVLGGFSGFLVHRYLGYYWLAALLAGLLASLYNVENLLFRLGWNPAPGDWDLTSLPNVLLPALVLLAAGAGAFAVQRRHRTAA
jgi:hypothetical protein